MSDLPVLRPDWPAPAHVHALSTTRAGGVSLPPYASLNLGLHVGDDPAAVTHNRARLRQLLPAEPVWLNQVHGVQVVDAAATKPFGFTAYYPGPGLGGHCIPIDPFYLTWKAREYGVNTRFIELAGEVNSSMPDYVVSKVASALNLRKKSINGSRVLVLGIAYKKNVDDMRESPSVLLMEKLRDLGAEVSYSDPHVPVFPKMREHHFDLKSVPVTADSLKDFDCVLVATDHDKFDFDMIKANAQLVVDSRGKYLEPAANIVKA